MYKTVLQLSAKHKEYWRRNLKLTAVLLFIWFVVTYIIGFFALPLSKKTILGFPLSFYMAAQGSLIIYVLIIWYCARSMTRLDEEYDVHEGED